MRSSHWIAPAVVLFCCGTVARSAAGPSPAPQIVERIKIQEARVPQIETQAAREREQVEQWYRARRTAVVQEMARAEATRLSYSQREVWVQYGDLYLNRFYAPADFSVGAAVGYRKVLLGQGMIEEYLISKMADLLVDDAFAQKLEQVVAERLEVRPRSAVPGVWEPPSYLPLLQKRAQELLIVIGRVRTQVAIELAQLENQRKARLDAIMEEERDLKEQVRSILEYLRQSESRRPQFGVVESVGYCPASGYFCMIEGVDRVLGVGDKIGPIQVLKIDPEKVEFAKDGTTWAQGLGASAQRFWD